MKIERISQNQIRCILTSDDLESRQLRISELAYGSEKAKSLFRDMMQQAHMELGFDANDIPLMIEMIPSASGTITLIITKVEDQAELDHRLSKFGGASSEGTTLFEELHFGGADDILDIFQKFYDAKVKSIQRKKAAKEAEDKKVQQHARAAKAAHKTPDKTENGNSPEVSAEEIPPVDIIRLYEFGILDDIIEAAISISPYYHGVNSLYKDIKRNYFMLVLHQSDHTPEEFNKICNMLSEYASGQAYSAASEAYLQEHKDIVIAGDAIQKLSMLK